MKGDWWVVYQQKAGKPLKRLGYARFEIDHPPFQQEAIERGQVRFSIRRRVPQAYDMLPGEGAKGKTFPGPIAYAEWFAEVRCGLPGNKAQAYRRTGSEVWVVEVTDEKSAATIEVFVTEDHHGPFYDAFEL